MMGDGVWTDTMRYKKGTGLGIYNSLLGITLLPASLIAGILYDKVNSSVPFYFGASTAFIAAIFMFVFYRRKQIEVQH